MMSLYSGTLRATVKHWRGRAPGSGPPGSLECWEVLDRLAIEDDRLVIEPSLVDAGFVRYALGLIVPEKFRPSILWVLQRDLGEHPYHTLCRDM